MLAGCVIPLSPRCSSVDRRLLEVRVAYSVKLRRKEMYFVVPYLAVVLRLDACPVSGSSMPDQETYRYVRTLV